MLVLTELDEANWLTKCRNLGVDESCFQSLVFHFGHTQLPQNQTQPYLFAPSDRPWQMISTDLNLQASIDFDKDVKYHRKVPMSDPLLKAVTHKITDRESIEIWDATLGFARDAAYLAQRGFRVRGFERNSLMYLLLKEAQSRSESSWCQGIFLTFGEVFAQMAIEPDLSDKVIYFDPLFEVARGKSKSRKEMELLKAFGADADAAETFAKLRQAQPLRLIVKRADKALFLAPPRTSIVGKTVRFDVY